MIGYHFEGKSYAELESEQGVPENTVRSRLHRGRATLRGMLSRRS